MQERLNREIKEIKDEFKTIQEFTELEQQLEAGRATEALEERI